MSPSYVRLAGPPRASTPLAGKYTLYLYHEHGYDREWPAHASKAPGLALPVLFAPGNAGSYKQVRSLAAAAARQYAERPSGVPLDFFAVDFNEDFSAFHAETLLDQAEYLRASVDYILSLYARYDGVDSVVVVGHSMGGIAARQIRLTPGYRPGSVAHILTLATPHALPAVTFDARMDELYDRLNAHDPGPDTTLVSVCGGAVDTTIASDACAALGRLAGLADPDRAFSVFTTSIPGLHAPVDHQAMMWCDQLRQALASALLAIVDRRGRLKPPDERIERFREALLVGLPDERYAMAEKFVSYADVPVDSRERLVWRSGAEARRVQLPVHYGRMLRVLTDGDVSVAACADEHYCAIIPPARIPDRSADDPPRLAVELSLDILHTHAAEYVVIDVGRQSGPRPTFLVAEWVEPKAIRPNVTLTGAQWPVVVSSDLTGLALSGGVTISVHDALVTDVELPALDTSLLAYTVDALDASCPSALVQPVLRASTSPPHESHYFPAVRRAHIYQHASAPFLAPYASGLHLTLWRDPTCETMAQLRLRVDFSRSVGKVVLRYRFALIAWPVVIAVLVLGRQLSDFHGGRASDRTRSR